MTFTAGVARKTITPRSRVELAGLGYYLERFGERVRDDLAASALVICDNSGGAVAFLSLDLMYCGKALTQSIRRQVVQQVPIPAEAICVHCTHTHSAPTATSLRGAGESDAAYLEFAAKQGAAAVIEAYSGRQPATLSAGWMPLEGITVNRTRDNGPVDTHLSVLSATTDRGDPLAIAVNFHAHPCALMELDLRAISRDVPGEMVDRLETSFPGATALYFQGTCGDVNFSRELTSRPRCHEPGEMIAAAASKVLAGAHRISRSEVRVVSQTVRLPTRRWSPEEITADHEEGSRRLRTGDTTRWTEGIARTLVNEPLRLAGRYDGSIEQAVAATSRFAVEWTEDMLAKIDAHPTWIDAEIQAIRVGDVYFAAHPGELFSSFGIELRQRWPVENLFLLGYSNDGIGYIPDDHDIERRTYAAITSPKNRGEFPYTRDAGQLLVQAMESALASTDNIASPD